MNLIGIFFHSSRPIPNEQRANFTHLFLDVIWWGILSGSTLSFIAVYAVRLGADPGQIGWLNAVPAIVSLLFALPVGQWLGQREIGKKIFWSSVLNRIFYPLFIILPWILTNQPQIWLIIIATLVMSIPMTFFTVGFNSLFADAVPAEWRGYVVAVRNAALSITSVVTSLIAGQILNRLPFPVGYQIVFALGFLGAAVSSYHLWFVRPQPLEPLPVQTGHSGIPETSPIVQVGHPGVNARKRSWQDLFGPLRIDILKGSFGKILLLLFFFHLSQFLGIPIFPLYQVNQVHFSDQVISLGVGIFNFVVFLGSTQLPRLYGKFSNKLLTGAGVILMATYPALMAFSRDLPLFAFTSIVGGIAWSIVGGTLYNFIMDWIPGNDRPAYLSWYHLALNAAILAGSLLGPLIANTIGLPDAMLVCAGARLLAGLAILRWG